MLDLTTLYVMVSLASVVAGIVHVVPWATGRFGTWAAWWGFGHVLLGCTSIVAMLRDMGAPYLLSWIANPLSILAYAAIFTGMRRFAGSRLAPNRLLIAAAIAAVPLLLSTDPTAVSLRVGYLSIVRALFDAATALVALRLARRESLHTGWIMVSLFAPTVPLFLLRSVSAFGGNVSTHLTGPHGGLAAWVVAISIAFIMFRGFALFILAAERAQRRLTGLIERDPLTGALNRAAFERRAPAWRGEGAALMIDLDLFKQLNDRCGHAAGDAALRIVAEAAAAELGASGMIFRWGGDEFVCVLPGIDAERADVIARAIATRFAQDIRATAPADVPVTLSIGQAHGPLGDAVTLVARADDAMYAIKARRPRRSLSGNDALRDLHGRYA